MKGDKIYVVTINEVSEFEQFDHKPETFEDINDAKEYLKDAKESAKREYLSDEEETGNRIDTENDTYFALYNYYEGWSHTHYEVELTECTIQ